LSEESEFVTVRPGGESQLIIYSDRASISAGTGLIEPKRYAASRLPVRSCQFRRLGLIVRSLPVESAETNTQAVLLTGATGFIGQGLLDCLARKGGFAVRALTRDDRRPVNDARGVGWIEYSGLDDRPSLRAALRGVEKVAHVAARAHVMHEKAADPLAAFRKINTEGTLTLAEEAARQGVRRFVFVSSIKVNGERTVPGRPFTPDDVPAPVDAYGMSKREAEDGLRMIATRTGMEVVIIRPPLVYGAGVKGNFLSMMKALHRGIPLPLGALQNKRSLVARSNLTDLITTCLVHKAAANEIFLASDGDDLSTTDLLRRVGQALGRRARLFPVPAALLELGAAAIGRRHIAQRLCGSLQVDITKARNLLGWTPVTSVDREVRETARHFLASVGTV
jgi:nucleoside-diphosphate-sugar epimerase